MFRRLLPSRPSDAPLTSRAEHAVEPFPTSAVRAPLAYVVALTIPIVVLELAIDDRTVRLTPS